MTEADLLRCIEAVDKRRKPGETQERVGGKFQPKASIDANGKSTEPIRKSAQETARIVGTSQAKVERTRRVLAYPKEGKRVGQRKASGRWGIVLLLCTKAGQQKEDSEELERV